MSPLVNREILNKISSTFLPLEINHIADPSSLKPILIDYAQDKKLGGLLLGAFRLLYTVANETADGYTKFLLVSFKTQVDLTASEIYGFEIDDDKEKFDEALTDSFADILFIQTICSIISLPKSKQTFYTSHLADMIMNCARDQEAHNNAQL